MEGTSYLTLAIVLVVLLLAGLALIAWSASILLGFWVWPAMGGLACLLAVLLVLGWEDVVLHLREGIRRISSGNR